MPTTDPMINGKRVRAAMRLARRRVRAPAPSAANSSANSSAAVPPGGGLGRVVKGTAARVAVPTLLALLVVLVALLVVSSRSGSHGKEPLPTAVRVERVAGLTAGYPLAPFDRTLADPTRVAALYRTVRGLPAPALYPAYGACPIDPEAYRLTFTRGASVLLAVTVHTGLCGRVDVPPGQGYRQAGGAFWAALGQALGVSADDLRYYPDAAHPGPQPTPTTP